jgi:hypothetical protein
LESASSIVAESNTFGAAGRRRPWGWWLVVTGMLLVALGLRLWGITWGLPFPYNVDERAHFVPKAVGFFTGDLNPHYQLNPAGFSYLLALVYAAWFRSATAVQSTYATDPTTAFLIARLTSAALGTASVGLVYMAGERLFDRWCGLLAGGILAVAFLPVFYAHQAINDAPTLAAVALSLVGAALTLRRGRTADYLLAGFGAGAAAAMKYNAGIVLLALVGAAAVRFAGGERRRATLSLLGGGTAAIAGFLLLHPYAVLDFSVFRDAMRFLVEYNARPPLVGERQDNGWLYYAWTLTWGFGWGPLALAVVGALLVIRRDRAAAAVAIPTVLLFWLYMGSQGRYFGRYIMPIMPVLALLAAYGGVQATRMVASRRPRLAAPAAAAVAVAALAQGIVYSVHSDVILSRADTRAELREWMVEHIPARTRFVMEPTVPRSWFRDAGLPRIDFASERWSRWQRTPELARRLARRHPGARKRADFQNYPYTLFPAMLDVYRDARACWYVSSSTQRGREIVQPGRTPDAIDFYRALDRESEVVFRASPLNAGTPPPRFQWDLSFNYYPLSYERPGPIMTVHRLRHCRPARG